MYPATLNNQIKFTVHKKPDNIKIVCLNIIYNASVNIDQDILLEVDFYEFNVKSIIYHIPNEYGAQFQICTSDYIHEISKDFTWTIKLKNILAFTPDEFLLLEMAQTFIVNDKNSYIENILERDNFRWDQSESDVFNDLFDYTYPAIRSKYLSNWQPDAKFKFHKSSKINMTYHSGVLTNWITYNESLHDSYNFVAFEMPITTDIITITYNVIDTDYNVINKKDVAFHPGTNEVILSLTNVSSTFKIKLEFVALLTGTKENDNYYDVIITKMEIGNPCKDSSGKLKCKNSKK